jgi:Cu+-exporting ATPase
MAWQGLRLGTAPRDLLRVAVLVPPLLILALAGDWWQPSPLAPILRHIWVPVAFAALVILGFGLPIFWRGLVDLARLRFTVDLLLAIGAGAGLALAFWLAWRIAPDANATARLVIWRDAAFASSLIAVAWLGEIAARPDPVPAHRSQTKPLPPTLTIPAGDLIPVDAVVKEGRSEIQDPNGTDDIYPTVVSAGDRVHAGSRNGDAALVVVPLPVAVDHHEQAGQGRGRSQLFGLSGLFRCAALAMFVLAILIFCWRLLIGPAMVDPVAAGLRLLMLTAPLGLGLAMAAPAGELMRAMRQLGVEVHDLGIFERLLPLRAVVFGHRGVLIPDRHRVISVLTPDGEGGSDLIARAASVAQAGHDPWGRALLDLAVGYRMRLKTALNYQSEIGAGAMAEVADRPTLFGNREYLESHGIDCSPLDKAAEEAMAQGRRLRWVGEAGKQPKLLGFIVFGAPSVAGAVMAVKNLDRLGLATAWLADKQDPGHQALARHLKIGQVLPMPDIESIPTLDAVKALRQRHGPLLYVTAEPLVDNLAGNLGPDDVVLPFGRRAAAQSPNAAFAITRQDPRLVIDILRYGARYQRLALINLVLVCAAAAIVAFWPFLQGSNRDLGSYEIAVILLLAVSSLSLRSLPTTANEVDEE